MAKHYRIHPAIGIARLGNSPEMFLGPELPGTFALPPGGIYRDAMGRLRRQAARFWVFEYDDATGDAAPVSLAEGTVARIIWTIHLKNKKAVWFEFAGIIGEGPNGYPPGHPVRNPGVTTNRDQQLVIDPGPRTIVAPGTVATSEVAKRTSSNPASETWPPLLNGGAKSITSLGTLSVDTQGRLSVSGGYGVSGTIGALPPDGQLNFDNNNGWFDDVSDGPVMATVEFTDGTTADATPAWVTVAPPDFAPPVQNLVTMYDVLFDLGLRFFGTNPQVFGGGAFLSTFRPSFTQHVYPVLRRALEYRWVINEADRHTSSGRFDISILGAPPAGSETPATNPRDRVFRRLRNPDALTVGGVRNMPRLHNDGVDGAPPETSRFSITRFQFFALKQWAAGTFMPDWLGGPPAPATTITPAGLDRASLEAATGGSFFPGMEMGWTIRDPRVYITPFEFRFQLLTEEGSNGLTAGDATKRMALPWQADFLKCGSNWWPAQRPNQVFIGTGQDEWDRGVTNHVHLTDVWSELGIVAPDPTDPSRLIETERTLP